MSKDNTKAAMIVVGNEILSGRTQDANVQWVADKLASHGVILDEVRIVPDDEEKIIKAVNELRASVDYVFTTGGIGPTHDDITAESVAKALGLEMETNDEAFRTLEKYYGIEELTPPRIKMTRMPVGAQIIANPVSGAPGFSVENVYVMAGVPAIMQGMLDNVIPTLDAGAVILSNTLSCRLPESALAEDLGQLDEAHPDVEIGSYPHFREGNLGLSVVLRSSDEGKLKAATEALVALLRSRNQEPESVELQVPVKDVAA